MKKLVTVEKEVTESWPQPLGEVRSKEGATENKPNDLLDVQRDGIIAIGAMHKTVIEAVGDGRGEQDIDPGHWGDLPDLSCERVRPAVHDLRDGTAEANCKGHHSPKRDEPVLDSIVKHILTAIGNMDYN